MTEEQFKTIIDRARAIWPDARCAPHDQGYLAQTSHLQGDVYRRLVIYRRTPRVAVYGQWYADARRVLGPKLSKELSNHGQYVINIPKKKAEGDEAVWFGVTLNTETKNWAECQDAVLDLAKKVWELLNKWGAWGEPNQLRAALQIGTDEI